MTKYELALVVSAKIEDDARTATVEKAKDYIVRAGGTVTEVEDWGKKKHTPRCFEAPKYQRRITGYACQF